MGIDPVSLAITVALNAAMMAVTMSKTIEGPRMTDLSVTVADYGTPLTYVYGIRRVSGVVFYAEPIVERKKKHKGKGGKYNEYRYFGTFAVMVADHEIQMFRKGWLDKTLAFDATGPAGAEISFDTIFSDDKAQQYYQLFYGTEDQEAPERMVATVEGEEGAGTCPAYLGVSYIFFEDLPLENFANRFPQFSGEISTYDQYHTEIVRGLEGGASVDQLWYGYAYVMTSPNGEHSVSSGGLFDSDRFITFENTRGGYDTAEFDLGVIQPDGQSYFGSAAYIDNDRNVYGSSVDGSRTWKIDPDGNVSQIGATDDLPLNSAPNNVFHLYGLFETAGIQELYYVKTASTSSPNTKVYRRPLPNGTPVLYDLGSIDSRFFVQDDSGNVWIVGVTQTSTPITLTTCRFDCVGGPDAGAQHIVTGLPPISSSDTFDLIWPNYYNGKFYVPWNAADFAPSQKWLLVIDASAFTLTTAIDLYAAIGFTPSAGNDIFLGHGKPPIDTARNQLVATEYGNNYVPIKVHRIDLATYALAVATVDNWPPTVSFSRWQRQPPSVHKYPGIDYPYAQTWIDELGAMIAIPEPAEFYNNDEYPRDFAFLYIDDPELVYLSDICNDVAQRLDMSEEDYDFLDLDQVVTGYSWTQAPAKDIISRLLTLYDSDIRPNGFVLEGIKRGNDDEAAAIGYDWFVRNESNPSHTLTMASESDLTRRMFLTFADTGADQQPNTAVVQRSATSVLTRREMSLDLSNWASSAADAQQLLERVMRRSWVGSVTLKASLPPHYLRMLPAGVRTFNLRDDLSFRGRLTRMSIGADRVIDCAWEQDSAVTTTTRAAPGAAASGMPPQTVYNPVDSLAFVLDIPLLADTHDQSTPFQYVAGAPTEEGDWPGVDIQMSESGSADSFNAGWDGVGSGGDVLYGTVYHPVGTPLTSVVDWGTELVVLFSNGDPTSYTEDEILANQSLNQFIMGARDRWVIGQFCTATLQSEGEYVLQGIVWGARGTERHVGTTEAGDRFFVVSSAVHRHDMGASKIGDADWYQGVTLGASDTTQPAFAVIFSAAANRPYSPVHVELTKEANGDWTITWLRRTRIGGALLDGQDVPLGETSEAYKVRILEGISGTALRTIETTIEEATYNLSQQVSDFGSEQFVLVVEIVQMSPVLGIEGYETLAYV